VAADDDAVLPPCEDRLDEAKLSEAALEGVELRVADPPGVGGIGAEVVEVVGRNDERLIGHEDEQNAQDNPRDDPCHPTCHSVQRCLTAQPTGTGQGRR
jgi:hypothetical protein